MNKALKIKSKNYLCFYQQKASKEKPTQNKQKCCFSPLKKKRNIYLLFFCLLAHVSCTQMLFIFTAHIFAFMIFMLFLFQGKHIFKIKQSYGTDEFCTYKFVFLLVFCIYFDSNLKKRVLLSFSGSKANHWMARSTNLFSTILLS